MQDLSKLKKDLDSDIVDKVFAKVKNATGGYDKMSAADISNMGDMIADISLKDMKTMNATVVRPILK